MGLRTSVSRTERALLACLCVAGTHVPASAVPPADLDAYAARALHAFGAPGMAVAIVEGSRTYTRCYGVRTMGAPEPVDEHTTFPIGSNTKAFTSTALAILVDRGKLAWSDRVVERLPGFEMFDPYASHEMTLRDLLTHRSGLGLSEGDLMFTPTTNRSRADVVHALRYLRPATSSAVRADRPLRSGSLAPRRFLRGGVQGSVVWDGEHQFFGRGFAHAV